jgi:hypothetical protein
MNRIENPNWTEGEFAKINATEVGTPCLRYVVRQPDGHRDVDDLDKGEYSFGAFGFRKDIGGEIQQKRRERDFVNGHPMIIYAPNLDKPFDMDFFGVTSPGIFNYEILDKYQQKLSLVGVAHLHMHTPEMRGSVIASFKEDGNLNYIEVKSGKRRFHDSILLFEDRAEFKIGSQLTGIRRKDKEIFGVPKWSFSEDISSKIVIHYEHEEASLFRITNHLQNDQMRLGHPSESGQFSNRQVGIEVELSLGRDKNHEQFEFFAESATLGKSRLRLESDQQRFNLLIDEGEESFVLEADRGAFARYASMRDTLTLGDLEGLDIDTVVEHVEGLYSDFHTLLGSISEARINIE